MTVSIHPTAIVDAGATLGEDVSIGPYCVVGQNAVLGDRVALHAHVVVPYLCSPSEPQPRYRIRIDLC